MSTSVIKTPDAPAPVTLVPQNDVNLLRGVTWEQYLAYRDNPDNDGVRMHYADGELLQMTTGRPHERIKMLLSQLLTDWALRTDINLMTSGQWTMQRETVEKGLEADNCFHISSFPAVEGKKDLDLEVDPPPDLAIEVDITTHSDLKFSIYAGLGVPEIWIWDEGAIAVFRRNEKGEYEQATSRELPDFPFEAAASVINEYFDKSDLEVIRAFRAADASFER